MNRTPSITTRTHASISLGGTDESHVHACVAVEFIVGPSFIAENIASECLSLVIGTELNNQIDDRQSYINLVGYLLDCVCVRVVLSEYPVEKS